jgi:hypothetical protein
MYKRVFGTIMYSKRAFGTIMYSKRIFFQPVKRLEGN